jgi:hypothetical protein
MHLVWGDGAYRLAVEMSATRGQRWYLVHNATEQSQLPNNMYDVVKKRFSLSGSSYIVQFVDDASHVVAGLGDFEGIPLSFHNVKSQRNALSVIPYEDDDDMAVFCNSCAFIYFYDEPDRTPLQLTSELPNFRWRHSLPQFGLK